MGRVERSEGLKANGQSATALNTTWPRKRSHVTWATGTASLKIKYLPVESSAANQTGARVISPIAFSRWLASLVAAGAGRGVIAACFCINPCQNTIGGLGRDEPRARGTREARVAA